MRAIRYDSYGPAEVLHVAEVPDPQAGPGEVLVRVHAAGVHPVELAVREGKLRRFLRQPLPRGLGADFAGVVAAAGAGVSTVRAGDRVWGVLPHLKLGSTAEFVVVPEKLVSPAPADLTLIEAAALPAAGTTVIRALTRAVRLTGGQRLLVRGASGGAGVLAVQLGRSLGAHVTALAGAGARELVESLGADEVVDYRTADPASLGRFHVILDLVGTDVGTFRKLLAPKGRLIALAMDADHPLRWMSSLLLPGVVGFSNNPSAGELAALARAVEKGELRPVVGGVLPMEQVVEAHHRLARGGVHGRLILTTGDHPE
ncbi:NADP-dependent oxidoreductase [Pseudosporangium ferrugineum]|uniref:NADPH:quinone reductase-like Zn-dependent oxidoreductase n=1 Tax=Pseudosporangium ferrugineum TaxID=439699 RepID=A0A2T0S4K1_9ACTN|nr:NADP-dependent oxidoreductase [Pseudosporangium ferrugineum]PRY28345.1 NADPH:quinone reductase-like Zn-dependent oxidoreductase [Pseudosporangium ferrugineum]